MFKLFKDPDKINSLDDLKDERARELAKEHGLNIKEILPQYSELIKEIMVNNGKIGIPNDSRNSSDVYDKYKKKLACGAVISYELTKRNIVKFPYTKKGDEIKVCEEDFKATKNIIGSLQRTEPIETYENIGEYYECMIRVMTIDFMLKNRKSA